MGSFSAERAVSSLDGSELWVVLDPGYLVHGEASDFLRALRGAGRSPHTIRAYAGRVASFLGWCAEQGIAWSSIGLAALARFKHFLEATPYRDGRLRSGATVNATLTAVCEFLRFCARTGVIDMVVAERLSEPRWLRFIPPGFDAGESGQFRTVRARALKARAQTPFPEALTGEQVEAVLACCRRPREQFTMILLRDTGLRIGEALGLRRADMHLLPDCRGLGCTVVGAHVHVRHRANPNGALAKSRFPRTVPASDAVLAAYADYQHERSGLVGGDGTEMVLVNLYHAPLGAPMTYRAAKGFFDRLARACGFPVRPHMPRHTAATNWVRAGVDLDVVQALLGHASLASTTVYLHARDEDKRRAVEACGGGQAIPVSRRALRPVAPGQVEHRPDQAGWLRWLRARLDPAWRAGEWDEQTLLFTSDLASPRTAAWPCRTPGCPTVTRRPSGRCDGCRRARTSAGIGWAEFDTAPPPRTTRPLRPGRCSVPGCQGDLHCSGLCLRHERMWGKNRREPVAAFIARAHPLARAADCRVPGCGREHISRRGLCRFHDNRLKRRHRTAALSGRELDAWIAAQRPRLGGHQFCLAGLPELLAAELRYALQCRDQAPPPLDPTQVRILLARLGDAPSLREADPQVVCESGGMLYNTATRGLFRDLRRHLDRAWAQYADADPFTGDLWQVALLDLPINASRRWPATQGVVDFRVIELPWLREIVKDWARTTRPYLQRLRETLRACQAASHTLTAAGRTDPTRLHAGDFTRILDAIVDRRSSCTCRRHSR